MSLDVYSPCPCGSGKKLKFCCQAVVADMDKVAKLRENHQTRAALQHLEQLEALHPGLPWVATANALVLLDDARPAEAAQQLERLLEKQPDHPFALALSATSQLAAFGYEQAKPAIHRAFRRCLTTHPDMLGAVAVEIGVSFFHEQKYVATREHLVLAMRLVPEDARKEIFMRLADIDGDRNIPYPLRGIHPLSAVTGKAEIEKDALQAARLTSIGCFEQAADIFTKLTERESANPALWHNAGLCRAWDGNDVAAAEALHRAASLHSDFAMAVECETIAQLLDLNSPARTTRLRTARFPIGSVSKVLSILDGGPRLVRMNVPNADSQAEAGRLPAGMFQIVDREMPVTREQIDALSVDTVPNVIGQVAVYDRTDDGEQAAAVYLATREDQFDEAAALLKQAAGDAIDEPEQPDKAETGMNAGPTDWLFLQRRWCFPPKTSVTTVRKLEQQRWEQVISEDWPNAPLAALGGKTPLQAAADPKLKLPLAASISVLDAFCDREHYQLNRASVERRVGLDSLPQLEVGPETQLNALSVMQLLRVPIAKLSDAQLLQTVNRAMLVHHGAMLYELLQELLKRPQCFDKVSLGRVYMSLAELSFERFQREEMFQWIERGKEFAKTQEHAFEGLFQWEMRELTFRLQDPDDPELKPLLIRMTDYYGRKIPQLRPQLMELLAMHGLDAPWELEGAAARATAPSTPGGLWTPSNEQPQAGSPSKLWLPGQ